MIRIVVVAIALMASLAYAKTGDGTWDPGGGWRGTNSGSITFKFLEQPSQEALARLAAMPAPPEPWGVGIRLISGRVVVIGTIDRPTQAELNDLTARGFICRKTE